jgi:hypothetical protein
MSSDESSDEQNYYTKPHPNHRRVYLWSDSSSSEEGEPNAHVMRNLFQEIKPSDSFSEEEQSEEEESEEEEVGEPNAQVMRNIFREINTVVPVVRTPPVSNYQSLINDDRMQKRPNFPRLGLLREPFGQRLDIQKLDLTRQSHDPRLDLSSQSHDPRLDLSSQPHDSGVLHSPRLGFSRGSRLLQSLSGLVDEKKSSNGQSLLHNVFQNGQSLLQNAFPNGLSLPNFFQSLENSTRNPVNLGRQHLTHETRGELRQHSMHKKIEKLLQYSIKFLENTPKTNPTYNTKKNQFKEKLFNHLEFIINVCQNERNKRFAIEIQSEFKKLFNNDLNETDENTVIMNIRKINNMIARNES